jgi:flavorubredoxin
VPSIGYRDVWSKKYCKIILTTDGDLIKDGVQSIDDEFLEWFVENPSCEEVEVITKEMY